MTVAWRRGRRPVSPAWGVPVGPSSRQSSARSRSCSWGTRVSHVCHTRVTCLSHTCHTQGTASWGDTCVMGYGEVGPTLGDTQCQGGGT